MENTILNLLDLGILLEKKFGKKIALMYMAVLVLSAILLLLIVASVGSILAVKAIDMLGAAMFGPGYIGLF